MAYKKRRIMTMRTSKGMRGKGIGDAFNTVKKGVLTAYKWIKEKKPASKILKFLDKNPGIDIATSYIPYAENIKKGLKYAKKAGFRGKGKVGRPKKK